MAEVENKSQETWFPRVEAEGLSQRLETLRCNTAQTKVLTFYLTTKEDENESLTKSRRRKKNETFYLVTI